ncbi:MAG: hypothetical protein IPF42_06315 [Candidatus Microthrix sp.]|nr:hypothetical protein [Candidatus Microthrix sp.]
MTLFAHRRPVLQRPSLGRWGDRVRLWPAHVDLTVARHER